MWQQSSPTVKQPPHDYLFKEVTVREPGFAYVFVSNEHPTYVDIYFDDVTVTHTPSPIVSSSDYFAFGLQHSTGERAGVYEQRHLYNGKELQDELSLATYDFGWRQYDPTIGRWSVIDQLAEKYYPSSPYTFVANNPINFIDPDGREIEEGSRKEWDKQRKSVENRRDKLQKRIDKLEAKAEKKGWSAEKIASKTNNLQGRVDGLNTTIAGLDRLESSSQVYQLQKTNDELGGTTYDPGTGNVVISFGSTSSFVHESTHAVQFEHGDVAFSTTNGQSLGQDVYDEMDAYRAQWAYDPSSVSRLKSTSVADSYGAITATWVQGITASDGSRPYSVGGSANTGIVPVNISSTRSTLMQAYPGVRSALMGVPANYSLISSPTTYYHRSSYSNPCHE
ncbi:MAG: hypothetical protein HRU69_07325 [Flammeovirgaceae bacterium]|nr:MAG: hypothetical protein HRU69_07325 [Flammeovirgaceae bacterium]